MIKYEDYQKFVEIIKKGYSLDHIWILQFLEYGDLNNLIKESAKIDNIVKTLIRKGLLSEDYKVTLDGKELLNFLSLPSETKKIIKSKVKDESFDLFWSAFPSSDTFEYKNKKFTGSRALRINKEECRTKLKAILNTGEYKIEDIVKAVFFDVNQKKEMSYKTGTNKLSYIQNSLTYLRQLSFDPFIELSKNTEVESKSEGVNI